MTECDPSPLCVCVCLAHAQSRCRASAKVAWRPCPRTTFSVLPQHTQAYRRSPKKRQLAGCLRKRTDSRTSQHFRAMQQRGCIGGRAAHSLSATTRPCDRQRMGLACKGGSHGFFVCNCQSATTKLRPNSGTRAYKTQTQGPRIMLGPALCTPALDLVLLLFREQHEQAVHRGVPAPKYLGGFALLRLRNVEKTVWQKNSDSILQLLRSVLFYYFLKFHSIFLFIFRWRPLSPATPARTQHHRSAAIYAAKFTPTANTRSFFLPLVRLAARLRSMMSATRREVPGKPCTCTET